MKRIAPRPPALRTLTTPATLMTTATLMRLPLKHVFGQMSSIKLVASGQTRPQCCKDVVRKAFQRKTLSRRFRRDAEMLDAFEAFQRDAVEGFKNSDEKRGFSP